MAKVPALPKFYWSGEYLEQLGKELGDKCIFLCLSPVSFRMLTDMTAMLLWPTRYEEGEVPESGRLAHQELNVPCLQDLHQLLDAIQLQNNDWLQSRFDDLGSRMTELEQMDINVNQTVNNGCGCDGATTTTSTNTVDGMAIDPADTGTIPPYMTDIIDIADVEKCRSANYLAAKVIAAIRTLGQIGDAGGGVVAIAAVVGYALTLISPVLGDEVIATAVILRWVYGIIALGESTDFIFEYFSDLANAMEGRTEELVCLLYDYNTASELGASLAGWIENMVEELRIQAGMSDVAASMMSSVLVNIFGSNVINYFVENVGSIVPADFTPQYDCTCGATGDSCPVENVVLAGVGTIPDGDLSGTMQAFASEFNSSTGYHEIIVELADNYCVTIDNATYTPDEAHEKCSSGVMVASDGSCIRRFVARSLAPFATAVELKELTTDCICLDEELGCIDMTTQSNSSNPARVSYSAQMDDANENWNSSYRLAAFGASSATITAATVGITITNPNPVQSDQEIGFRFYSGGAWTEVPLMTAGEVGGGGVFTAQIPSAILSDVWSGNFGVYVRNSDSQGSDVQNTQTVSFGNLCLHGSV